MTLRNVAGWFDRHERVAALLPAVFIVMYCLSVSLWFNAPNVTPDELGYLNKAQALAGHATDTASSFHAGYSLIIAPAFLLFSDTALAWRAIMVVNALLWGLSFYLLARLLRWLFPNLRPVALLPVLFATALYPSWVAASGYALTTSAFVAALMANLLLLRKIDKSTGWALLFGASAGFLYWIHPLGLAFLLPVYALLFARWLSKGLARRRFAAAALMSLGMVLLYARGFQPWLNDSMTPDGQQPWEHYADVAQLASRASYLLNPVFWVQLLSMVIGQVAQVLVASFGVAGYALFVFGDMRRRGAKGIRGLLRDERASFVLLCLALLVASAAMGSVSLALYHGADFGGNDFINSYRIYGRYTELFLLPLLPVGLLAAWRFRRSALLALVALSAGLILQLSVRPADEKDLQPFAIASFWPGFLDNQAGFIVWFAIGAAGILIIGVAARFIGKRALLLTLPFLMLSVATVVGGRYGYQAAGLAKSAFTPLMQSIFPDSTCVGFAYSGAGSSGTAAANRRIPLFAYENSALDVRRMSLDAWQTGCDGPYLTPDVFDQAELDGARYVAREENSGLYLIAKEEAIGLLESRRLTIPNLYLNPADRDCVIKGCTAVTAAEIRHMLRIGSYRDGTIYSDGRSGTLLLGRKHRLAAGAYTLTVDAVSDHPAGAHIKIQGYDDEVYLDEPYVPGKSYVFEVAADHAFAAVELAVAETTEIGVRGYEITIAR